MTSWIAIVISSFALLISIIAQRDKLLSFFDELKNRFIERTEKQRALTLIGKFANPDSKQQPSLLAFYIPVFLTSIISSAALRYLAVQPQFQNTILLSSSIYLSISMIVLVTFLVTAHRFELQFVAALFLAVLMVSGLWGIFIMFIEVTGIERIWSGIIAGIAVILFLVAADLRASSQARKKKSRSRLQREKDDV